MRSARPGRLQPVRDDDRRTRLRDLLHGRADPGLGGQVEVGGRLVQQQHGRVDQLGPGQRDELALPGGQRLAALGHLVQVAAGQGRDEVVRADRPRRRLDLGVARLRAPVGDVVPDGAGEQERLLRHVAELLPVGVEVEGAQVDAVDEHRDPRPGRRSGRAASSPSTCRRRSRRPARRSRPAAIVQIDAAQRLRRLGRLRRPPAGRTRIGGPTQLLARAAPARPGRRSARGRARARHAAGRARPAPAAAGVSDVQAPSDRRSATPTPGSAATRRTPATAAGSARRTCRCRG